MVVSLDRKAFDAEQPRDEHGKWTQTGTADRTSSPVLKGSPSPTEMEKSARAALDDPKATRDEYKARIASELSARLIDHPAWREFIGAPPPGTPSRLSFTAASERKASALIQGWAGTSADARPVAIAMQRAVQDEFGLHDAATEHMGTPELDPAIDQLTDDFGGAYRAFARAMYDNTQAELAKNGIKEMTLYRGLDFSGSWQNPDRGPGGAARAEALGLRLDGVPHSLEINQQPASSWAYSFKAAKNFSTDAGTTGAFMAATVPASRILSTMKTGWGCKPEDEVVVLGGKDTVTAQAWDGNDPNSTGQPANARALMQTKTWLSVEQKLQGSELTLQRLWHVLSDGQRQQVLELGVGLFREDLAKLIQGGDQRAVRGVDVPGALGPVRVVDVGVDVHGAVWHEQKEFDPSQPRDADGKWAATGAATVSRAEVPSGYAGTAGNTAVANARRDAAEAALNDEAQSRTEYKGRIAKALNARLKDNPVWKEYVARQPVQWVNPLLHVHPADTLVGQVVLGQGPGDASETHAANLIQSWASSSGDHNPIPVAIQAAIKDEFGLKDAVEDHMTDRKDTAQAAMEEYARNGPAYRVFARAVYDETQANLKANGITEMTLYRGMSFPGEVGITPRPNAPDPKTGLQFDAKPHVVSTVQQPASSWSYDFKQARNFSPEHGESGAMLAATVPASRILSTMNTGWGCKPEKEVVVLGGKDEVNSWAWYGGDRDGYPPSEPGDMLQTKTRWLELERKTFDPSQPRNEGGEWTSGGGGSTVSVKPEDRAEIDKRSKAATGHTLSDTQLAALVGAPGGSKVRISLDNDRYRPGIAVIAEHPDIEDQAVARLLIPTQTPRDREEGKTSPTELHYEQVFLKPEARGKGTGVKMMADAVAAAHQAGIPTVTMTAAGAGPKSRYAGHAEPGENGYYVWPRLGFDGPISDAGVGVQQDKWPAQFKSARTVSDLMRTPGGAQHWKDYGDEISLSMDTDPKSPGRQVMDAYVKQRGLA